MTNVCWVGPASGKAVWANDGWSTQSNGTAETGLQPEADDTAIFG